MADRDENHDGDTSRRLWLDLLLWVGGAAVLLAVAVGGLLWFRHESARGLDADDLNKSVQTVIFMFGFLGVVATGVITYHRQRTNQDQLAETRKQVAATENQLALEREKFTKEQLREVERSRQERYAQGAEMIAHDSPAVRIAGLNVITQLGREVDTHSPWRQTCLNLVCAYLRATPAPPDLETYSHLKPSSYQVVTEEVCRLLPTYLDLIPAGGEDRAGHPLDVDLRGSYLTAVNFSRRLLGYARFDGAAFSVGADFDGATFTKWAGFDGATFTKWAGFDGANFFVIAGFEGSIFRTHASFHGATFDCNSVFRETTFTDSASFGGSVFRQPATFDGATFDCYSHFVETTFSDSVSFKGATFHQPPDGLAPEQLKGATWPDMPKPEPPSGDDGPPSETPGSG